MNQQKEKIRLITETIRGEEKDTRNEIIKLKGALVTSFQKVNKQLEELIITTAMIADKLKGEE